MLSTDAHTGAAFGRPGDPPLDGSPTVSLYRLHYRILLACMPTRIWIYSYSSIYCKLFCLMLMSEGTTTVQL